MKKILILITIISLFCCSPRKRVFTTAQIQLLSGTMNKANALYKYADYSSLIKAFNLYEELTAQSFQIEQTSKKLVKSALILALREKELAMMNNYYIKKALQYIDQFPAPI